MMNKQLFDGKKLDAGQMKNLKGGWRGGWDMNCVIDGPCDEFGGCSHISWFCFSEVQPIAVCVNGHCFASFNP